MKYSILLLVFFILTSCREESNLPDDCIMHTAFNDWRMEGFKDGYTIQLPEYFIGMGMQGFEGNMFERYNPDSSIMISYAFCNGTYCYDFGDTIPEPLLENVLPNDFLMASYEIEIIDKYFCSDDQLTGLLYYVEDSINRGVFYMKGYGGYLEAASILFDSSKLDTVCIILSTVDERMTAVVL